jgi:hypothetical protein
MRFWSLLFLSFCAAAATAQQENAPGSWLNLEYTYNNIEASDSALSEKGAFAGIRGELGLNLTSNNLGASIAGEYMDGSFQADGSAVTGTAIHGLTRDYIRDLRALAHYFSGGLVFSAGLGQREWYDNLVVTYPRRETYNYYPLMVTFYRESVYFRFEYDVWSKGKSTAYMSTLNPAAGDVSVTRGSGNGYGLEVGYVVPASGRFGARAFLSYHRWDAGDSDSQAGFAESKTSATVLAGGLGVGF